MKIRKPKHPVSSRLFILFIIACSVLFSQKPSLCAAPLEELLELSQISVLKAGGRPTEVQFKDINFQLFPRRNDIRQLLETLRRDLDPSVMVETLFLYQKPKTADKTAWTEAEFSAFYNELIALSTLQGIQYFSASRGAMRTFYEISVIINNPSAKKPLPDPSFPTPPQELSLYARQKDLTFGDNVYQYTFFSFPGAMVFIQENLSSLNAGIIPAVGKNKLRSCLAFLDSGEYLVIYAVSMAKTVSLPGLKDRIGDSFSNRAEAIIQWVVSRADRAFGL